MSFDPFSITISSCVKPYYLLLVFVQRDKGIILEFIVKID